jgi:hypothetical protein
LDVGALVRDLGDLSALSFVPIALFARNFVGIGATVDDAGHALAEFLANFIEAREAALVLHRIVQQRGDGFVFTAAVLDHDSRDTEQMADIGLAFALAALVEMQFRRVAKRLHKSICEERLFDDGLSAGHFFH